LRGKSGGFLQDIVNLAQGMQGEQGFQIFLFKNTQKLILRHFFSDNFNNGKFISQNTDQCHLLRAYGRH
jgi:hypothetical protein